MSECDEVSAVDALKTMGYNCAVMVGVSFFVVIIACAFVGVCPDDPAFIPIAMVAIGGGIAVGGLVTCFGGDVREI